MKKLMILIAMLAGMIMFSCSESKPDEPEPVDKGPVDMTNIDEIIKQTGNMHDPALIGTWGYNHTDPHMTCSDSWFYYITFEEGGSLKIHNGEHHIYYGDGGYLEDPEPDVLIDYYKIGSWFTYNGLLVLHITSEGKENEMKPTSEVKMIKYHWRGNPKYISLDSLVGQKTYKFW